MTIFNNIRFDGRFPDGRANAVFDTRTFGSLCDDFRVDHHGRLFTQPYSLVPIKEDPGLPPPQLPALTREASPEEPFGFTGVVLLDDRTAPHGQFTARFRDGLLLDIMAGGPEDRARHADDNLAQAHALLIDAWRALPLNHPVRDAIEEALDRVAVVTGLAPATQAPYGRLPLPRAPESP